MAHTWKLAIGLGFLGASLAAGCVVKNGDDDSTSGAAGEGGTGGSGGSSAKGGTGGTTGGSAGKGGSSGAAGKAGSGTGGATGGAGGSTGGTGGSTGGTSGTSEGGMAGDGTSGTGGSEPVATCDPASGELPAELYGNCDPDPPGDECQVCIHDSCCDLSQKCYGIPPEGADEPYNVCGWGGPDGRGEIKCFEACLNAKVKASPDMDCTADDEDACLAECTTPMCGAFAGNATLDLATCMQDHCAQKCFGAATCGE